MVAYVKSNHITSVFSSLSATQAASNNIILFDDSVDCKT